MIGEGHFHEVNKALQRREFTKEDAKVDGVPLLKENLLNPPKQWVIKKVKDYKLLN